VASESIDVSDSVRWETRSEYYRKNPKAFAVVIAITVFGPFLGLFLAGWPLTSTTWTPCRLRAHSSAT
jgi:hypothetical protein